MAQLIDPRSQDRTLIIMRHGQADMPWGTSDFDRRLTEHGEQQAHDAARWLLEQGAVPEMIVCSAALRTRQTCTWVMDALGEKAPTPKLESALYAAGATSMLSVVNHVPETVNTLMVISHMPGIQSLALRLASRNSDQNAYMDLASSFPTSAFAVFEHTGDWATLDGQDAELTNFVVPR